MAKIDPYYNLINTILNDKKVVIFLGAGASMEGRIGENNFPGYNQLVDDVLKKYGAAPTTDQDRINTFYAVIDEWQKNHFQSTRLHNFLKGEPGYPHYYLAALSIALHVEKSNALFYITTNYDNLLNRAFSDLERNSLRKFELVPISLWPKITGSDFQNIVGNIDGQTKEGRPVILKLFGDLDFQNPIFKDEDMKFEPTVEDKLVEWMKNPMIIIGYSFSDKIIKNLFQEAARSASPVFIVNPSTTIPASIKELDRVHHIKEYFSDFMSKLLKTFKQIKPEITKKVDEILKFIDIPPLSMNFESAERLINECSQSSIIRAEEKLPKVKINGKIHNLRLIPREDTGPNFQSFIRGEKPLFAIIGDSGSGKSTLFYQKAKEKSKKDFLTLFYDVHHIQNAGSLSQRIAEDFQCDAKDLGTLFQILNKLISRKGKKLLILIDGLNEITSINPVDLKNEIDSLGKKLPANVKIAYSCRTVYWNSYIKIDSPISTALYHTSKEFILHFYSIKETERAFKAYQKLYEFVGAFNSLSEEFKKKIRDPLMLRMLSEGYQGTKLPSFAPAVKIFKSYENSLRNKFKENVLMGFLEELVIHKLSEVESVKNEGEKKSNINDQFDIRSLRRNAVLSNLALQQLIINKKNPIILLEDEGILSSLNKEKKVFRFTYDRLFEYLLGKEIGEKIEAQIREMPGGFRGDNFIEILKKKISKFQKIHFSFIQALKSEIIRQNIEDSKGIWSFFDSQTLKSLINNNTDAAIVNFTKEVLRELTFESEVDILPAIKGIEDDELKGKFLALDIAGDSPKIKPILLEGLFSGDKHFTRRCILNIDKHGRENTEEEMISILKKSKEFKKEHAMGLIYYTAILFSLEDTLGKIKIFWKTALSAVTNNFSDKKKLDTVKNIINYEFLRIVKDEGPLFFAAEAREDSMEYLWENMPQNVREAAFKLVPLIADSTIPISPEIKKIIWFFGSELKYWEKRENPDENPIFVYKFEFLIVQWILIKRSETQYEDVKNILESFVKTGFWASMDFALYTMEYILRHVFFNDEKILRDGFKTMKRWTEKFEKETKEFYDTIYEVDPFPVNYIPVAMVATIDFLFFTPPEGPVPYLEGWLTDKDTRRARLALLCTRYLWRENPRKILGTLELVVNSQDTDIKNWLDRILREIYMVYPRLVEDFFWKTKMDPSRVQLIKFNPEVKDAIGFKHDISILLKNLLISKETSSEVARWYKKMLEFPGLDSFCSELLDFFVKEIKK